VAEAATVVLGSAHDGSHSALRPSMLVPEAQYVPGGLPLYSPTLVESVKKLDSQRDGNIQGHTWYYMTVRPERKCC